MKFPVFYLLNREFVAETGSPQTACTTKLRLARETPNQEGRKGLAFSGSVGLST
jgi:hypothetical protein